MKTHALLVFLSAVSFSTFSMSSSSGVHGINNNQVTITEDYTCEGGSYNFSVTRNPKDDSSITIDVSGDDYKLLSVESGSGELYRNSDFELFMKGDKADIIYIDEGKRFPHSDCKVKK